MAALEAVAPQLEPGGGLGNSLFLGTSGFSLNAFNWWSETHPHYGDNPLYSLLI